MNVAANFRVPVEHLPRWMESILAAVERWFTFHA